MQTGAAVAQCVALKIIGSSAEHRRARVQTMNLVRHSVGDRGTAGRAARDGDLFETAMQPDNLRTLALYTPDGGAQATDGTTAAVAAGAARAQATAVGHNVTSNLWIEVAG